ncbi:hypothetical protein U9M48_034620 [Paspalum notatum var. saurae]|uniref:Uncharacterized protein n=1 Tax=Paspalum notatum var. saurae TaxID=547442 RepID=A0AAQ3UDW0_PASNO
MDSAESTAAATTTAAAPRKPNGAADPVPAVNDIVPEPEVTAGISTTIVHGGSVESHRFFMARRTALEMLRDRGYTVPEAELARTLPEFHAWWADKPELERLAISATLASDPSNKVKVVFCQAEPMKIAAIREICSGIKDENLSRLILVLQSRIMTRAKQAIKELFSFKVDTFQITELLVNITEHALMSKHEVLTAEEKAKFLKEYNVMDSQLPRMLEDDAIARYYGLGKGTVIKITYDSEPTRNHVTYRCIS